MPEFKGEPGWLMRQMKIFRAIVEVMFSLLRSLPAVLRFIIALPILFACEVQKRYDARK